LDRDAETSANASNAFIGLGGGEMWDRWDEVRSSLVQALQTEKAPQSRLLGEFFAFTSIPMSGSVPGLYRLYHSTDLETRNMAECALTRAEILVPNETRKTLFSALDSQNRRERESAYRDLENLGKILWGSGVYQRVAMKFEGSKQFQDAWTRCTVSRNGDGNEPQVNITLKNEPYKSQSKLVQYLEEGLSDSNTAVQMSCAKALIPIGQQVDKDLGYGGRIHGFKNHEYDDYSAYCGKPEIQRLLLQASKVVEQRDPLLARQCETLAVGFDRPRIIG